MNYGLRDLISFWDTIFSSPDPVEALKRSEKFEEVPEKFFSKFQMDFYPEPYYGYFHEDMSNDVLLLLLNPGQIKETNETNKEIVQWNHKIKERYTNPWTKQDYCEEEDRLKVIDNWREKRFNQTRRIVGDFGFLHTMEFFPFHSKHYPGELTKNWVYELNSTQLSFQALKEIATTRKIKHILAIGSNWAKILEKSEIPLTMDIELIKREGKKFSFKFQKFQFTPESLPILICTLGSRAINLPADDFSVKIAQILLGISKEAIPTEHPIYNIIIK